MADDRELDVAAALEVERQFVLTLGGYALEIPGAYLVTHERIGAPRFNFVQDVGVGAERQTAFFERALDHYFQRALRPTFRVARPPADHLDRGLRRLGFRPRPAPLALMLGAPAAVPAGDATFDVRPMGRDELDDVASFWAGAAERPEFRAALEVAWSHPNPQERLAPLLAASGAETVACALAYRYRGSAGIFGVATRPLARGRGAASALVAWTVANEPAGPAERYAIFADSERLATRLARLGFRTAREYREYELPRDAELALPPPTPVGPPRWRPPRAGATPESSGRG